MKKLLAMVIPALLVAAVVRASDPKTAGTVQGNVQVGAHPPVGTMPVRVGGTNPDGGIQDLAVGYDGVAKVSISGGSSAEANQNAAGAKLCPVPTDGGQVIQATDGSIGFTLHNLGADNAFVCFGSSAPSGTDSCDPVVPSETRYFPTAKKAWVIPGDGGESDGSLCSRIVEYAP